MVFENNPFIPTQGVPLYQQLYIHLRTAILTGQLKSGTKLPSTRGLAEEFNLARNTVVNTYRQLRAEGYLEGLGGSGTFVARVLPDLLLTPEPGVPRTTEIDHTESQAPTLSARTQAQLTSLQTRSIVPLKKDGRQLPFGLGMPALDVFPHKLWSQLVVRQARRLTTRDFTYQEPAGHRPLREAIATHITVSRRVRCTPDQIVIVAGTQGGLDLAARLLIDQGDPVWMEDPGYIGAHGALLGAGARLIPVPVDENGLVVKTGIELAPHARLVYTTPAHQFPLGMTMSLVRRLALLDWAKRTDAYILEDDYDSEFRFAGRPLAALQSLDEAGRVIYIGTFSKVLSPALRIGYLILPTALIEPAHALRRLIDFHLPILEQAVLADFMAEGHFRRHLRRTRALLAERRTALLSSLSKLPLDLQAPPAGSHCVAWLPENTDEQALMRRAIAHNLNLWPLSTYCLQPSARAGLVLGYGDHTPTELKAAARRLASILRTP